MHFDLISNAARITMKLRSDGTKSATFVKDRFKNQMLFKR